MGRLAVRNNNTGARLNLKILDIASRAYQMLLFKFIAGNDGGEKTQNATTSTYFYTYGKGTAL